MPARWSCASGRPPAQGEPRDTRPHDNADEGADGDQEERFHAAGVVVDAAVVAGAAAGAADGTDCRPAARPAAETAPLVPAAAVAASPTTIHARHPAMERARVRVHACLVEGVREVFPGAISVSR
jgi:hypothetical protein